MLQFLIFMLSLFLACRPSPFVVHKNFGGGFGKCNNTCHVWAFT